MQPFRELAKERQEVTKISPESKTRLRKVKLENAAHNRHVIQKHAVGVSQCVGRATGDEEVSSGLKPSLAVSSRLEKEFNPSGNGEQNKGKNPSINDSWRGRRNERHRQEGKRTREVNKSGRLTV